jgi:hypothetical protein
VNPRRRPPTERSPARPGRSSSARARRPGRAGAGVSKCSAGGAGRGAGSGAATRPKRRGHHDGSARAEAFHPVAQRADRSTSGASSDLRTPSRVAEVNSRCCRPSRGTVKEPSGRHNRALSAPLSGTGAAVRQLASIALEPLVAPTPPSALQLLLLDTGPLPRGFVLSHVTD